MLRALVVVAALSSASALPAKDKTAPAKHNNEKTSTQEKLFRMARLIKKHSVAGKHNIAEKHITAADHIIKAHASKTFLAKDVKTASSSTADIEAAITTVNKVSGIYSAGAMAHANMEWTKSDSDDLVGETAANEDLEIGGSAGETSPLSNTSAVHDGDMMMTSTSSTTATARGIKGTTTLYEAQSGKPWTDGILKYCYPPETATSAITAFEEAILLINKAVPNIKFENVGYKSADECNESPAVYLTSGDDGCWSYVGELTSYTSQGLNLQVPGCDTVGIATHELLHALGQGHEQARPDRDTYVTVDFDNMIAGYENNFEIASGGDTGRPYDVLSLMHYGAGDFSANGADVITVKDVAYHLYTTDPAEYYKYSIGQRVGLSQLDADQLAEAYGMSSYILQPRTCEDETEADGSEILFSGWTCTTIFASSTYGPVCSNYSPCNAYCCDCGGGLIEETWLPASAEVPTVDPAAPPSPSPDPSPPPSPPPPSPPPSPPSPPPPCPPPPSPPPPPAAEGTLCTNECHYPSDVLCDDGGSGSEYSVCEYGSDCDDCGPRSSPPSPPPSSGGLCTNTCSYFNDDDCDDGGSNSQYSACEFGTDCADCGARSEEAASCDADCYSYTCDFWTTHGYACSTLEGTFGCDCSGCACAGTSSVAETSPVNNKKLMLQPHKPAVAGSHKPAVAGSKADAEKRAVSDKKRTEAERLMTHFKNEVQLKENLIAMKSSMNHKGASKSKAAATAPLVPKDM